MQTQSYMQRERAERRAKRIKRIAKVIIWLVILGVPFALGVFTGRITKVAPSAPAYEVKAELEQEYHPDLCTLDVVSCPGEQGYEYYE